MMYQICPVCNGSGLVSRPSYIAGDQTTWVEINARPWPCKRCGGSGTIEVPR